MIATTWILALILILWGPELSVQWERFLDWLNRPAENPAQDPAPEKVEVDQ